MDHGKFMTMHSGRLVHFLDPRPEEIWADDIAHALSLVCRFGGHVDQFYSVAQHCIEVATLLKQRGHPVEMQLCGLLHDATEAYLGDVISPVKQVVPKFKEIENNLEKVIYARYGLPFEEMPSEVKQADRDMLKAEARSLFAVDAYQYGFNYLGAAAEDAKCLNWPVMGPEEAKTTYLEQLGLLWRKYQDEQSSKS